MRKPDKIPIKSWRGRIDDFPAARSDFTGRQRECRYLAPRLGRVFGGVWDESSWKI